MDLQEFVTQTLLQIVRGISEANKVLEPERKKPDGSPLPKLFRNCSAYPYGRGSGGWP